jgi:hypothetical protein
VKWANAADHGARGIIELSPLDLPRGPATYRADTLDDWFDPDSSLKRLEACLVIGPTAAAPLFTGAPQTLEYLLKRATPECKPCRPGSFPLCPKLTVDAAISCTDFDSRNVVALLRGSHSTLKNEYVVFTAHYDAIGPTGGGACDGAIDDGAGTAGILEIARAFSLLETPPARSILFVNTTGEETGLDGASCFAKEPPVDIKQIVANVNLDANVMLFETTDIVAIGAKHSTLASAAEAAARGVSRKLVELRCDLQGEGYFARADNFSFVEQGVPAVLVCSGQEAASSEIDNGPDRFIHWVRDVYHSAGDSLDQDLDWHAGAIYTQFAALLGAAAANGEKRPAWNPGNFFGDRWGNAARRGPSSAR